MKRAERLMLARLLSNLSVPTPEIRRVIVLTESAGGIPEMPPEEWEQIVAYLRDPSGTEEG